MTSLRKQNKSFDMSKNPFLNAQNPYRVKQKFYTQFSSEEKFTNKSSLKNLRSSYINQYANKPSFLDEFPQGTVYLKQEKQNIQKMSSLKFRYARTSQNPFQRKRLIIKDPNINKTQQRPYSRNDERKLFSLLERNPFKKYAQKEYNQEENDEIGIRFHQIKLEMFNQISKKNAIQSEMRNQFQVKSQLLNFGTAVQLNNSLNSKRYQIFSLQNSPNKKSKISPTFANIETHRRSSTSSSKDKNYLKLQNINDGLMKQISRSRTQLFGISSRRQSKQTQDDNFIGSDKGIISALITPFVAQQQANTQVKKTVPYSLTIRGRQFFHNQVKLKY